MNRSNDIIYSLIIVCLLGVMFITPASAATVSEIGCDTSEYNSGEVIVEGRDIELVESDGDECQKSFSRQSVLDEAVDLASDGDTIIIKQKSGIPTDGNGFQSPYAGVEITQNKELTIRGEGVVAVEPETSSSVDAPFVVNEIDNKKITLENLILTGSDHVLDVKSNSTVQLNNVAVDGSVNDVENVYKLEKTIASSNPTGAQIITNNVYYPTSSKPSPSYLVESAGSDPVQIRDSPGLNPVENVFERRGDVLSYNPITRGSISNKIKVDKDSSSSNDESIVNNFKTLQGAVEAADSGAEIRVAPSSTAYSRASIEGYSVSGAHNLTITDTNPADSSIPEIEGMTITYSGDYNLSNLHISSPINVNSNNINVDASGNYWGTTRGPNVQSDIQIPRGVSSTVATQPFCSGSDCSSIDTFEYPYCTQVNTVNGETQKIGCNTGESPELEIEIGELKYPSGTSPASDIREFSVDIDKSVQSATDVNLNIIESDTDTDASVTLDPLDGSDTDTYRTTFGSISRTMVTGSQDIQPRVEVSVNGLDPVVVSMDEFELVNPSTDDSVTVTSPTNTDQSNAVVGNDSFDGVIPTQNRSVSRFNAETSESPFQDNSIPPISTTGGSVQSSAVGELREFTSMRTNSRQQQAILIPKGSLNIGFSMQNIPQAEQHTLVFDYGYQAEDVSNNYIDFKITDENGNVISPRNPDIQIEPTSDTSNVFRTGSSAFGSSGDIGGDTLTVSLTKQETEYINQKGSIYFQVDNSGFETGDETLHVYNSRIVSTDNVTIPGSTGGVVDDSDDTSETFSGDLRVSMDTQGSTSDYGTYDIEPGQSITTEIDITNTGETTREATFVLRDEYSVPDQNFPESSTFDPESVDRSDTETLVRFDNVRVRPGETITRTVTESWPEAQFGTHTMKLVEEVSGSFEKIGDSSTPKSDIYVRQPTTIEVSKLDVPDEYVTQDSFNAEVELSNIGDLSGKATVNLKFGKWESTREIEFSGGDARSEDNSDTVELIYSRDDFDEVPSSSDSIMRFTRREYTTPMDVIDSHHTESGPFETSKVKYEEGKTNNYYRADAPFATSPGNKDFEITTNTDSLSGSNSVFNSESAIRATKSKEIDIYEININSLEVNVNTSDINLKQRPTEDEATVYASAWPYTYPSYGQQPSKISNGQKYPVLEGERTMYSADMPTETPSNRASLPLNNKTVDRISYPNDRYFSQYYTHQNRVCNKDQLKESDGQVQVPESDASESDLDNVFMAFSADRCNDPQRITDVHGTTFVHTSNKSVTVDSRDKPSQKNTSLPQPSSMMEMQGPNTLRFDQIDKENHILYAYVNIENEGSAQPVTARFEIVTNKSLPDSRIVGIGNPTGKHQQKWGTETFDDNVVGAAAVELRPGEEEKVPVPVVIRNNKGVEGIHELSVRPRKDADVNGANTKDYIDYTDDVTSPSEIPVSPISNKNHDQWTVPIKVETYGDAVLKSFEPDVDTSKIQVDSQDPPQAREADVVVNEVCDESGANGGTSDPAGESRANLASSGPTSDLTFSPDTNEGVNVQSGDQDSGEGNVRNSGTCVDSETNTDLETATFEAEYTNYGGEPVEIRPEAIAEFEAEERYSDLHRLSAHATGDRYFSPYESDSVNTQFNGKTWSEVRHDGSAIGSDTTITIPPGKTETVELERKFQEPGLYHVRMSPCRQVSDNGPQYYNLEGFTGIPDSIDNTTSQELTKSTWANSRYTTARSNINRLGGDPSDSENLYTSQDIRHSIFHGSLGCATKSSSVFVYDTTEPVADIRVGHAETTVMDNKNEHTHATTSDGEFENTVEVLLDEDFSGGRGVFSFGQPSTGSGYNTITSGGYHSGNYLKMAASGLVTTKQVDFTGHREVRLTFDANGADLSAGEGLKLDYRHSSSGGWTKFHTVPPRNSFQSVSVALPSNAYKSDTDFRFRFSNNDFLDDQWYVDNVKIEGRTVVSSATSDYKVIEGGLLFMDGSTTSTADCQSCYSRPHFEPYGLETPKDSDDYPGGNPGDGNDFRGRIKKPGTIFSYRMSVDNARIAGSGMPGEYPSGSTTQNQIQEKGIKWTIEGGEPNYGQKGFCEEVNQDTVDEHCYMERFEGNNGGESKPDYYEVVPHRFTEPTDGTSLSKTPKKVKLQVWDDPTLTENEANTNKTEVGVNVIQDEIDPTADLQQASMNDLSYDAQQTSATNKEKWHRMEDIFGDVSYRSTPNNFDNKYDDVYEGTRTCLESSASDSDTELGISQDEWTQVGGNDLDAGTRVIDDGDYVEESGTGTNDLNLWKLEVDMGSTRDGNLRCLVFEEEGPSNNRERTQEFEYNAWDYAENKATATKEVDVEKDTTAPDTIDYNVEYDTATGNNPSGADNGWVWAHNIGDRDFYGDDVRFDVETEDNSGGIGTACLDLRFGGSPSGPSTLDYSGSDIHNNCQSMGDNSDGETPQYEGTHGNDNPYGIGAVIGSSNTPGVYTDSGWFSSSELGSDYSLSSTSGTDLVAQEKIYVTDWHGNTVERTVNVNVKEDTTSPSLGGSITCSGDSCDSNKVTFDSQGPDGGTYIDKAVVVSGSVSGQEDTCQIVGDDGGSSCTYSGTSASVTSFDEHDFSGDININIDSSIDADAEATTPPTPSCSCEESKTNTDSVSVSTSGSGELKIKIWDAHGNTQTKQYSWSISDSDSDSNSESCSGGPCPEDDEE